MISILTSKPGDLLGRPVRDGQGRLLGVIRGLHQTSCPGGFEEVTIQNRSEVIIARVEELTPVGREFRLMTKKEGA